MIPLCEQELQNKKEENKKVKILYNSTGSNATTITLNDDIKNYDEYEVYYSLNSADGAGPVKTVKSRINEAVTLDGSLTVYTNGYYATRLITSSAYINGKQLNKGVGYAIDFKSDGSYIFNSSLNGIYIKQVIGYKK